MNGLNLFPKGDPADKAGHNTPPSMAPRVPAGEIAAGRVIVARTAIEALTLEMLQELRAMRWETTDGLRGLRGQLLNDVLAVEQIAWGAQGVITRSYQATIGSLIVLNWAATDIVYHSGPQAGSAPTNGKGVQTIKSGTYLTIPVGSRTFTLYGPTSGIVGVQVFAGMQAFGSGALR